MKGLLEQERRVVSRVLQDRPPLYLGQTTTVRCIKPGAAPTYAKPGADRSKAVADTYVLRFEAKRHPIDGALVWELCDV